MADPVTTLKPCPFCGGLALVERKGTAKASMIIACEDCGCRVESGDIWGGTKPKDFKWNGRYP